MSITPDCVEHRVAYRDIHSYCAHPHVIRLADGSLSMVFNRAPRREVIMHPPQDPGFMNVATRSLDDGETWAPPEVVPDYGWTGTECAGLTELPDGRVMLNQWRGTWIPLTKARRMKPEPLMAWPQDLLLPWIRSGHYAGSPVAEAPETYAPWCRNGGRTFVHFSSDGGMSFDETTEISTAPLVGGYGNRGGVVTADRRILLPLTDAYVFATVFLVTSDDLGRTWSAPQMLAAQPGSEFEEPATLICRSGKIIMVLRDNELRDMQQIESLDGGRNWSPLRNLNILGYPAHLQQLPDGRILMTYGWRKPDYGIRAVWSEDEGATWTSEPILIREGMGNSNLGYPCTMVGQDGRMLTLYYGEDSDRTTVILQTRWRMPD